MTIAARWPQQDTYADEIEAAAASAGVPASLAYGLIAQESGFNATAIRQEPTVKCARTGTTGDASYGLTQLLYCTALGLGFSGQPADLFDPTTNVDLGIGLLGQLLASHGYADAALSAYNGGDRPSLGYGAPRADGSFANQQYVDNIISNAAYFDRYLAARDGTNASDGGTIAPDGGTTDSVSGTAGGASSAVTIAIAGAAVVGAAYALVRALRR